MYVIVHQGGALRGAFGAHVIASLMMRRRPDLVLGNSIGAVNGSVAASGRFGALRDFWLSVDGKNIIDGISGFLRPSLFSGRGGLLSLSPLRAKLEKYVTLAGLQVPFGAGVVSKRTFEYITLLSGEMVDDQDLVDAVIGSSAIAFIMEPVTIEHENIPVVVCDAGHRHSIPMIPSHLLTSVTEVDVILCNPIEPQSIEIRKTDGIFDAFAWLLQAMSVTTQAADLSVYYDMARTGVKVRIFAPPCNLGNMLDTDNATIRRRWYHGGVAAENPVIL